MSRNIWSLVLENYPENGTIPVTRITVEAPTTEQVLQGMKNILAGKINISTLPKTGLIID